MTTISEFSAQNLSNTVWSLATLFDCDHEPLLQALAAEARLRISTFDSQALGNTAWAFAHLRYWHSEPLIYAISAPAIPISRHLHVHSHAALVDVYGASRLGSGSYLIGSLRDAVAEFVCAGIMASGWNPAWKRAVASAPAR
eukprot:gnl/TRDRNA2_/TRDRNA2_176740_c1_seq2.p1 gnl/TRDRNA2_/TRDRNA2_176740_c1~~gnl/TRDRNA2_/TRDRNA2_176740_c1_seq2.p1  ORF type:complete len:142 (-),score=3.51 gnl/TRDRNA2_/TRDRNA2_176740_c1_seq2:46-471(-)